MLRFYNEFALNEKKINIRHMHVVNDLNHDIIVISSAFKMLV